MNPMSIQDFAALTVIASFIGAIGLWIGSKLFATRGDVEAMKSDLQENTIKTSLVQADVKWIKAKLSGNEFPD